MSEQGTEEDQDRGHEEGDLQRGAQRDGHREVHIVLVGELDAYKVLGDVADYGDHDHTDKQLGDADLFDQRLDGPDEGL
jgi:hypothetical protein